jgi:hypothetical protein
MEFAIYAQQVMTKNLATLICRLYGKHNFHLNRRRMMNTALKQNRFQLDALEERIAPSMLSGAFDSSTSASADVHSTAGVSVGSTHVGTDVSASVDVSASASGSLGLGL